MSKLAFVLTLSPALALAQTQVVKPPIAQYWVSAETAAGMSIPGMGAMGAGMMGMMGGGAMQAGKRLLLQLGSQQAASGAPRAAHDIPPGMNMGPQLPLVTPQRERAERGSREFGDRERPKGRMLLYWGCGESVRGGQPVVLDFARMAEGQMPPGVTSRRVAHASGPAFGRSRTYGDWPNPEEPKAVPENASLRGDHLVKGNYSPEIRFSLDKDFMARAELSANGNTLRWNPIPSATGYFAMLTGAQSENEIVFWSSSEVQEMGGTLMDWLPPAEVARLIREKVVLPPSSTECTVPGEVVRKAGTPMVNFIAYGEEANFVHPPRPANPKLAWEQQWTVKVRFKATGGLLLGDAGEPRRSERSQREERRQETREESQPATPDPMQEGVKALRGIFGR